MLIRLFAIVPLLCGFNVAAHADTLQFNFGAASSPFSGSGTLSTGAEVAPGEYRITSVTGNAATSPNGAGIAIQKILKPGTFPTLSNGGTFPANDNILFLFNGMGTLSQDGLSFLLTDGSQINLYNDGSAYDGLLELANGSEVVENVPITIQVASTPEPSTFALLGTGLVSLAAGLRRRKSA